MKRAKIKCDYGLYARLGRIERKCDLIINCIGMRRRESQDEEIDRLVETLRTAAKRIAVESRWERKFFDDVINQNRGKDYGLR